MTYLLTGLILAAISFAASRRVLAPVLSFVIGVAGSYLILPVLQWNFTEMPALLFVTAGITFLIEGFHGDALDFRINHSGEGRYAGPIIVLVLVVAWLIFVPLVTTWGLFHAENYRQLIGDVKEATFSAETAPLDISKIRQVDHVLARKLAEQRLGEDTALGSQVEIGPLHLQLVRGELVYAGPLNHRSWLKWINNRRGTPGYVTVSATNDRDVSLVQHLEDGEAIHLRYNEGSCFGDDPHRYLYQNGYSTTGLTEFSFEIDDDGKPYWVVSKYERRVGFGGGDATGIVVLDLQTGKIHEYETGEAPPWVDRIQPVDFVLSQLRDWKWFVHGYIQLDDKDRIQPTPGASIVYGKDGHAHLYTGMTSAGADEGTVGFALVNLRTKETRFFKQAGATETVARCSAQGSVQEKGYNATFPVLYGVGGRPTYYMTLKDAGGLVKMHSFVSVLDRQVVGVGETVRDAFRSYRKVVLGRGNDLAPDETINLQRVSGVITRLSYRDGVYFFQVDGYPTKAFSGTADLSEEMHLTQEGDRVVASFEDGGNPVVDIISFDNAELELQKTEAQIAVEARGEKLREEKWIDRAERNSDALWEALSPEEKRKLLKR